MNDDDKLIALGSVFVLGLAGFLAFFFLYPFPQQLQVSGRSWQRNQYIERWQENVHEGWDVPTGGVVIYQERKKRSSSSYKCGDTTCTTNHYDDWYTYKIWEWTETHFIYTQGQENTPYDPDTSDLDTTNPTNPVRRGRTTATYTVYFTKKGEPQKVYPFETTQEIWGQLIVEQTYTVNVSMAGNVLFVKFK